LEVKPGRAVHSLRHTAGIAVFEVSGHDLTVAPGWLGHADVSTTRGYLGRVDTLRRRSVAGLLARPCTRTLARLHRRVGAKSRSQQGRHEPQRALTPRSRGRRRARAAHDEASTVPASDPG
jgi:hypothetical protein